MEISIIFISSIILLEFFSRLFYPNLIYRPTNILFFLSKHCSYLFYMLGFSLAKYLNLIILIGHIIFYTPLQDIINIIRDLIGLLQSISEINEGIKYYYYEF